MQEVIDRFERHRLRLLEQARRARKAAENCLGMPTAARGFDLAASMWETEAALIAALIGGSSQCRSSPSLR